jgi:autotransporter-associated beta strand protein
VGIMMRETLNANSAEIQMTLGDLGVREAKVGIRASAGAILNHWNGNDYTVTPVWYRLKRSGNTFTAYESSDGVTWFAVRSVTITMATTYYAGLVLVNGFSTANDATFDHVILTAPAAPTGLIATPEKNQAALSWIASLGAASYSVKRSTVSGGPYTTLATGVASTSYTDTTASSGTTYYYTVSATNADGDESNDSAEAEATANMVTFTGFSPYTGSIALGQGGILSIDNSSGTYASSVIRAGNLTINGGPTFSTGSTSNEPANFLDLGSASGDTNDIFGPLILSSGPCFVKATPNASGNLGMTFDSLTRSPGTQLNFGHAGNFGAGVGVNTIASTTANSVNVVFTTPPTSLMVGGAGTAGTTTLSILPFAFVSNSLCTYDSTYGLRALSSSTELATLSSGMTVGQNAKAATVAINTPTSVNSLWFGSNNLTVSGSSTLTVSSGAIAAAQNDTMSVSTLAFGAAEGLINVANSRTLTITSAITGSNGLTICLEDYNGTVANLVLGGSSTYSGITTIEGNNASLKVKLTNGLAFQNTTLDYNNYGASLQFGSGTTAVTSATFGGLKGAQNLALTNAGSGGGGVALTVGGDGDSTTYSGVLSGAGSLIKAGVSNLTLSGANTYTGATAINSGTLAVNGSLGSGSTVTVNSGGTLGGIGTVAGVTTVASGGALAPGNGGAGTFTVKGAITLNSGSVLNMELSGTATSDQIALASSYTASGTTTVNVSTVAGFAGAGTYPLITGATGISAANFALGTTPIGYTSTLGASGTTLSLVVNPFATPTGLTATGSSAQVALSWNSVSGATSYAVKRTTTSGSNYATIASTAATSYTDTGLANGTTYYYVVHGINAGGMTANSAEAGATTYTTVQVWRLNYFGTIANSDNAADTADPDGDGMTNAQEFIAGTNPNDRNSLLRISQVQTSGNDRLVSFPTVSGKIYRLEASNTLQSGSWTTVQDNIAGNGGTMQVTDTGGAAQPRRFYRVLVQ